ncbi:hypothetical protein B0H13DRAFT_2341606 [Mycena leptocephala]|nr:hypothetical protein B0H13DRAFT_2341606 [Mycena leptocephala]
MFSFTSLLALALAVTGAIARPPSVTTWSESIPAVDASSTLANCGTTVSYQNLEDFAISSTVFTAVGVSDATDNIEGRFLGLGPVARAVFARLDPAVMAGSGKRAFRRSHLCGLVYRSDTPRALVNRLGPLGGPLLLFNEKYHNRKVEKLFKDVFDVPGTVEPLAYAQCGIGEYFLFAAGGRYYFYSDGKLTVHHMEFTSPKEFLEHLLQKDDHLPDVTIPMRPGADLRWLYDT